MKRLLPMMLLLLLLLVGCNLRNRQSSEELIPTGNWRPSETSWTGPAGAGDSPLIPGEKTVVKTVLSYQGEIPKTYPVQSYSYQLPMIDLRGSQAQGCNQEIENRFGSLIRQSVEAMERYEEPVLEQLSYTSYTVAGILTLRIDRRDYNGSSGQAFYTVNAETGEAVSLRELFDAAGISGDPETEVNDALMALFTGRFGQLEGADASVTTALARTQAALLPLTANRMHLTRDGQLAVALELFAPDGGSSIEELLLP